MALQHASNEESAGRAFWAEQALLPAGWARSVRLTLADGRWLAVEAGVPAQAGDERLGTIVPGLGNLHSHAFQRGMAGLTEIGGRAGVSFWRWRELMYRFLAHLDPDSFQAIAEQAYVEMLESGFTRVGEFHYLHHDAKGVPHADPAEMSARVAAATQASGIGLSLLPVFYAHADFGGAPPNPAQRRLIHDVDGFARLLEGCRRVLAPVSGAVLGIAPHSLRAATPEELTALLPLNAGPVHIHIAEQTREVEACLAWSGQRPVEWLLAHMPVDARWCLVHATHVTESEWRGIVARRAVVGLCPVTEANLGDGLFPMREFAAQGGGRFGVGTDSNVLIDAAEELRLLEYGQRLVGRGRNVLARNGLSSGRWLFAGALEGGASALGVEAGLRAGAPADLVELETQHPALVGRSGDALLDSWIFAARGGAVRSVWRDGRAWVREGRHVDRERIAARYRRALAALLEATA